MNKICSVILPMIANKKANKVIIGQMFPKNQAGEETPPAGILSYIENSDRISIDTLKEQYDNTFKTKDKLEDKAKTNIIGITISISLIIGATGILSSISEKFENSFVSWVAILLLIASVTYMIVAGLLAIRVLINENETYVVKLSSIASGQETLRNDYDVCIAQNQKKNTIRNNYVFTSYACIRNALVCLFVILIFISIPSNPTNKWSWNNTTEYASQTYTFSFAPSTEEYIKKNDVRDIAENAVMNVLEKPEQKESSGTFGIVDVHSKLFIKYKVSGNNVEILLLEPYETP
jgi:hypothetical protein